MQQFRYFSGESRHDRVPRSMREAYQAGYTRLHVDQDNGRDWADTAKVCAIVLACSCLVYSCTGVV